MVTTVVRNMSFGQENEVPILRHIVFCPMTNKRTRNVVLVHITSTEHLNLVTEGTCGSGSHNYMYTEHSQWSEMITCDEATGLVLIISSCLEFSS